MYNEVCVGYNTRPESPLQHFIHSNISLVTLGQCGCEADLPTPA